MMGPAITATWKLEEPSATAWLKSRSGTRFLSTACDAGIMKARALPNSTRIANTGHTTRLPLAVKATSIRLHSSWAAMHSRTMRRRLWRSATWPAHRIRTRKGANWARPMRPRSNRLPVIW